MSIIIERMRAFQTYGICDSDCEAAAYYLESQAATIARQAKEIEAITGAANRASEAWNIASGKLVKADATIATLRREIERKNAALERIIGMCDVPPTCRCGRPNGLGAVVSCASQALADEEPPA